MRQAVNFQYKARSVVGPKAAANQVTIGLRYGARVSLAGYSPRGFFSCGTASWRAAVVRLRSRWPFLPHEVQEAHPLLEPRTWQGETAHFQHEAPDSGLQCFFMQIFNGLVKDGFSLNKIFFSN